MTRLEIWLSRVKDAKTPAYKLRKALQNLQENGYSMHDIAELTGISKTSIFRKFKKAKLESKTAQEMLKEKFEQGKLKPTIREFTEEQKHEISEKMVKRWQERPDINEKIKQANSDRYNKMSESEKKEIRQKLNESIRLSAKNGSKLEFAVADMVTRAGFVSVKHRTGVLANTDLEFDLYIPEIATIIEVDGPSHFLPIWGQERLEKNIERDKEKAGNAVSKGFNFIRVINIKKTISKKLIRDIEEKLSACIRKIRDNRLTGYYEEII